MLGCGCLVMSMVLLSILGTVLAILLPASVGLVTHAVGPIGHGPTFFHKGFPMDIDNGTLAILLVFGIPIVAIVGGIFLSALKILKGDSGRKAKTNDAEEARMIQDIYHGLTKMEQRVEALETLLLDKQRKGNES
jgi:phage shock protein B